MGARMNVEQDGYISDGLILRFDGIRNTRDGHENIIEAWENLAGIADMTIAGNVTVNKNSIVFPEGAYGSGNVSITLDDYTLEAVYQNVTNVNNSCTFGLYDNNKYEILMGYHWINDSNYYKNAGQIGITGKIPPAGVYSNVMRVFNKKATVNINGNFIKEVSDQALQSRTITRFLANGMGKGEGSREILAIRLYNRALTDSEISKNLKNDLVRFKFG